MSARAYKIIESITPPVLVVAGECRPTLRRILISTAGAMQSDATVRFAGDIARRVNAAVTLLHVMAEPPAMYANLIRSEEETAGVLLLSNSQLGRSMRRQKELLESVGVSCEIRLRHGLVSDELLAELRQSDYSMVVSGSLPARSRLRAYILRNVTREIVNRAETPVLVVRSGRSPSPTPTATS